jgi:hypothetical protein
VSAAASGAEKHDMCQYSAVFALFFVSLLYAGRIIYSMMLQNKYDPQGRFLRNLPGAHIFVFDWQSPHITSEFRRAWRLCQIIDRIVFSLLPLLLFAIYFREEICG